MRLSATCHSLKGAVSSYMGEAFDINEHISSFFNDPVSFRILLARTSAIVSGSNALQFFDRIRYPESDLDIFVFGTRNSWHVCSWLLGSGYRYRGSPQTPAFLTDFSLYQAHRNPGPSAYFHGVGSHNEEPRVASETEDYLRRIVFTFEKDPDERIGYRKVQVILSVTCALADILTFHSCMYILYGYCIDIQSLT